jgi:hypothetical protein
MAKIKFVQYIYLQSFKEIYNTFRKKSVCTYELFKQNTN